MYKKLSELKGYEDCENYLIYDDGRVYSTKNKSFLKLCHDSSGYVYLDIRRKNSTLKCPKVHRLVASLFIGEQPGYEINHKDGNKDNNAVSNLEYVTHEQNRIHAIKTGLADEVNYDIVMCDTNWNELGIFHTCTDALEYLNLPNGNPGNIGRAIRGKRQTAYGYKWKNYEGSTTIPMAE